MNGRTSIFRSCRGAALAVLATFTLVTAGGSLPAARADAPAVGPSAAPGSVPTPEPKATAPKTGATAAKEVTLRGSLGCGKCSFHEAKACQNVLKVEGAAGAKPESYVLADNAVSRANHEKVCGPASPATVTGTIEHKGRRKILTASVISFD